MSAGVVPTGEGAVVPSAKAAPREFFTLQSIGTLAGASSGLYVIVGAISQATDWVYPRWFPLVVALGLVVLVDLAVTQGWKGGTLRQLPARVLVLTLNGCLVFTSALGGAVAFRGHDEEPPAETAETKAPETTATPPTRAPEPTHAPAAKPAHPVGAADTPRPEPPRSEPRRDPTASSPASVPRAIERPTASPRPRRVPTRGFGRIVDAFN